jgi:peptidoglycan/LPS O-acetylase OafA/YrhL
MKAAGRLDYIDSLRGIAALMVVVQHAAQVTHAHGSVLFVPMLDTVNFGRFGVVMFFLISGFVIPFSFRGERPMRDFLTSRFFRLYPAYWLSLFAFVAMYSAMDVQIAPGLVLANMTMVQGSFGLRNIGFGYWTLNVEMAFYAICLFLFWRGWLREANAIGILAFSALAVALSPYVSLALTGTEGFVANFPFYFALFLTGLMLRRSELEGCALSRAWARWLVPLVFATGLVLSGCFFPVADNAERYFRVVPLATAMALPVVVFMLWIRLRPRVGGAFLTLGTLSYSLYLFQDLGLVILPRFVDPAAAPIAFVALVLAVSLAIAAVIYRFVERPMIALGRRIAGKPGPLPAVQAAS